MAHPVVGVLEDPGLALSLLRTWIDTGSLVGRHRAPPRHAAGRCTPEAD